MLAREAPNGDWDIGLTGWLVDFADPFDLVNVLLRGRKVPALDVTDGSSFDDPGYNRRLDAAARLAGPARDAAYARLDADLTGKAAPLMAVGNPVDRDFFSARTRCQVYQPAYGIDLAALCTRHG